MKTTAGQRSGVDAVVVGAGHNGLVCAILLARAGLAVVVLEAKSVVGGAARTEFPFARAKQLAASTGAYLAGLIPPELMRVLGLELPLVRRDPHYFLPTLDHRYLLLGSNPAEAQRQFLEFFDVRDWNAHLAMQLELAQIRQDLAPAWLAPPRSVEETAERHIRPALRTPFIDLVRQPVSHYLDRFGFVSDVVKAMYATTDGFSGLHGGYDTKGSGHNFLVHNMTRMPGSDGTFMLVRGGMGVVTQRLLHLAEAAGVRVQTDAEVASIDVTSGSVRSVTLSSGDVISTPLVISAADPFRTKSLVGDTKLSREYVTRIEALRRDGTTMKVNLAFEGLPTFRCLPSPKGQHGPTIHLLPQEPNVLGALKTAYDDACAGRLPEFPTIEWYFHTPLDPSLQDPEGHHNGALFVQWVPYALSGGKRWPEEQDRYAKHLLSICDRFAPDASSRVVDMMVLTPPGIEAHFGITRGHIHHVDNGFSFTERAPYELPVEGLYQCSAGCHPAGSVIGAAGHNAAQVVLKSLGRTVPTS